MGTGIVSDRGGRSSSLLLSGILLAVLVVPTGVSGTGVALPSIARDLGSQPTQLQWIVNAFNLTFAVFSLVAGSVADRVGRRRGLLVGGVVFALAGVGSGVAPNTVVLDCARAVAGVGAAMVFACSGAILATNFSGKAADRAFALFGTAAGLGLGLGPSISSAAIAVVGWPGIFWFNALALGVALLLVRWSRVTDDAPGSAGRVDLAGAVTFAVAMSLIIAAFSEASALGWLSWITVALFVGGCTVLVCFGRIQAVAAAPLLDLRLLRSPRLVGLLLVPVAGALGFVTLLSYYPTFLSGVWQLGPDTVGVVMHLMTAPVVVGPLIAGALHSRGVHMSVILGGSLVAYVIGAAFLTRAGSEPDVVGMAVPLLLVGLGFGLGVGLVDGQAIGSVPAEHAGMVSGLVSTVRLGSEAVLVAVFGGALSSIVGERVAERLPAGVSADLREAVIRQVVTGTVPDVPGTPGSVLRAAFADGMRPMLWAVAGAGALLAVVVVVLLSRRTKGQSGTPPTGSPARRDARA
ncbi:MFS transporter [Corynebacterium bovis]|uniref:MFS transporter n=1 Tax=Corynebacterium bovis TaxID=36808 RepID=UPI003139BD60